MKIGKMMELKEWDNGKKIISSEYGDIPYKEYLNKEASRITRISEGKRKAEVRVRGKKVSLWVDCVADESLTKRKENRKGKQPKQRVKK